MTSTAATPTGSVVPAEAERPGPAALPWWVQALLVFAASRVVTTALFLWVGTQATPQSRAGAQPSFLDLTTTWDGGWYWYIAQTGYPSTLPLTAAGGVDTNQWAFLPVYPMLVKLLTFGVVPWPAMAFIVSLLAGFGAAVLLGALLRPHLGDGRAVFAVAVFAFSPLAFVLETAYAESLGLLLLLAALLLVDRGRPIAAIPFALLLAFTRPGVLALALSVGTGLVLRLVRARRGGPTVPAGEVAGAVLLSAVCVAGGFAWSLIAAVATGVPDAYFATESAWRALWMPGSTIALFQPWLFAAHFWSALVVGAPAAAWVGPLVLVVLVVGFGAAMFLPQVRRLGPTIRLWAAAYALYLLAVFFPQSSLFRLLMPMAPLAGAVTPARLPARIAVLAVCTALQALWLWVCYGPVQAYWSVP
jgi:hypothetical protein